MLLYWLVPGVRAAVVSEPHIASDILDHSRRQEIMRVVNLQLMDVDETLRRFNPDWRVHRAQALRALLRVLQRAQPQPTCVGPHRGQPLAIARGRLRAWRRPAASSPRRPTASPTPACRAPTPRPGSAARAALLP